MPPALLKRPEDRSVQVRNRRRPLRSLAGLGQTRTWNLLIDVVAQTGRYSPDATNVNQASKFTVEGEKRYWLHVALGRDLNDDGSVDVLGTQLEEVVE